MNQRTDTATKIARLAALVICIPLLAGCVGAAVVGAGAGALMIADRQHLAGQTDGIHHVL